MDGPRVVSIQVGKPKRRRLDDAADAADAADPGRRTWYSGIYKAPVVGAVWLGAINLEGDGQADLRAHGGPNRAALCYAASHYPLWCAELGREAIPFGSFGENFTIEGLSEETVCMGDIYRIGGALVQVSQLRGPCWKLARRTEQPDMVERVLNTGRCGWYVRVLEEGAVEAGEEVTLIEREPDAPTMLEQHRRRHPAR